MSSKPDLRQELPQAHQKRVASAPIHALRRAASAVGPFPGAPQRSRRPKAGSLKGGSIKVCLFCGGRGSAALVRDLLRRPDVELSLLVNAYDDGLSTGALREFIPGMLGPSDFRKNMSYLLDLYSAEQYALQRLFEYRMPRDFSTTDLTALQRLAATGDFAGLQADLQHLVGALDLGVRSRVLELLEQFFQYFGDSRARPSPGVR